MQSAIHVRIGEGNKVLVFAKKKTMHLKLYLMANIYKEEKYWDFILTAVFTLHCIP